MKIIMLATMLVLVMLCPISAWSQASKYKAAADAGDANAQYQLGICYYDGNGVVKNETMAVVWWQKAAVQGLVQAQFNLGLCYYNGIGIAQDYSKAVEWMSDDIKYMTTGK